MARKISFVLVAFLLLSAFSPRTSTAQKSYGAERFNVLLAVQPDGSLRITETVRFRFEGGPFTFVFRDLAVRNLDAIDSLQASMDGVRLPEGTQAGQVEFEQGSPVKVNWHFAPTSDSTHEFVLSYRVLGAVRKESGADVIIWRAIPEDHEYTIGSSAIRLEYPPEAEPLGSPTLDGAEGTLESAPGSALFTTGSLQEDQAVDVTIRFPPGSLAAQPPAWQANQTRARELRQAALPYGLAAAGLTALLGLALVLRAGAGLRRDDSTDIGTPAASSIPPDDIAPALAARLTSGGTALLGTLFDLAQRGVVTIEEKPKRWSGRSFEIVRQAYGGALRPHEDAFLQALFAKGNRVPIDKISSLASNQGYTRAIESELVSLGWIDPERKVLRNRTFGFSFVGLLLGLGMAVAGLLFFPSGLMAEPVIALIGALLLGSGAALVLAGLAGLIVAGVNSPLSNMGRYQAAAWNGYSSYLREVTRGRQPPSGSDAFGTYLPYAAAFGIGAAWAKFFQKHGARLPDWFHSLQGNVDDGFVAIYAAISSADSAASSGGGGGGASGGGGSGAG